MHSDSSFDGAAAGVARKQLAVGAVAGGREDSSGPFWDLRATAATRRQRKACGYDHPFWELVSAF